MTSATAVLCFVAAACGATPLAFDAVVYDGTSGGVTAAVAAARFHGLRTALLCASWPACFPEGGLRVGGMSAGGLGQTDIGPTYPYIGGLALEFYERNRAHYGNLTGAGGEQQQQQQQQQPPPQQQQQSTVGFDWRDTACRLPNNACNVTFNLEPHVAQAVFRDMLAEAGVTVLFSAQVQTVQFAQPTQPAAAAASPAKRIASITLVDGRQLSASVWVDASYEGDLLARADASYTVGREARDAYNESLGGLGAGARGNQFSLAVDPFDGATGLPLKWATLPPTATRALGSGGPEVQSYNFRLCVTKNASNLVPFPQPQGYDAGDWELLRRYLLACAAGGGEGDSAQGGRCQLGEPSCNVGSVPAGKADMNNCGGFASDLIGGSYGYPEASYAERKAVWTAHVRYQQGVLWTMAHDPAVPQSIRDATSAWGLCADEFADNTLAPHWPPALYVRAARRLQGDQLFTQNTPAAQHAGGGDLGAAAIAIGGYNFDSHNAFRWACANASACYGTKPQGAGASTPFAWDEGDVQTAPGLYQIPYWVMMPKAAELSNLLVVAAPSATHIGMSTLRMEPQFMMVGHAAGTVAGLTVKAANSARATAAAEAGGGAVGGSPAAAEQAAEQAAVQDIDLEALHAALAAERMNTTLPAAPTPSPGGRSSACLAGRCVPLADGGGAFPGGGGGACGKACAGMGGREWLALRAHWGPASTAGAPFTMEALRNTFLKKTEEHSPLPAADELVVSKGTAAKLAAAPASADGAYWLVTCVADSCE